MKSDMSYIQQEQWGSMQRSWEEQKDTHEELCGVRKGWDSSCQCGLISKVREQIAQEIEDAVIEIAGNSAHTLDQAAAIARGKK